MSDCDWEFLVKVVTVAVPHAKEAELSASDFVDFDSKAETRERERAASKQFVDAMHAWPPNV